MILIAVGTITLLFSVVLFWRSTVEQRAIRWEMYATRDKLRRMALEDPGIRHSEVFTTLDRTITTQCRSFNQLSLWSALPVVAFADKRRANARQADFEAKLSQPQNEKLRPVHREVIGQFARHLLWRHVLICMLAGVTLVGIAGIYFAMKWLAGRLASDAIRPISAPTIERAHHAA